MEKIIKLIYKEKENNNGEVIIVPFSIIANGVEMELIDHGYEMHTTDNSYSYSRYYDNDAIVSATHKDIDFVKMYKNENGNTMYYLEDGKDFYKILDYIDCKYLISATIDDDIIRIGYTDSNNKYYRTNIKIYFNNNPIVIKKYAKNSVVARINRKLLDIRNKIFDMAKIKMLLPKNATIVYLTGFNPDIKDIIFNDKFMEDGNDLDKFIDKSLKRIENNYIIQNYNIISKISIPKIKIGRYNDNNNADTFDYVHIDTYLSFADAGRKAAINFITENKKNLDGIIIYYLKNNKSYKKYNIPVNFLKCTSCILTNDYNLRYTLSLKIEEL